MENVKIRRKYIINGEEVDMGRLSSASVGSGRSLTPLPPVKCAKPDSRLDRTCNKGSNSLLSMEEIQRRAQQYEKKHLRSTAFDNSNGLQLQANQSPVHLTDICDTKKKGQKRKKKEMLGILETKEKLTELSKVSGYGNRSLPGIGQNPLDASLSSGKLPKIQKRVITGNNVVDIISRHEGSVRAAAKIKQISEEYMKEAAMDITPQHHNNAPEVISQNEEMVGKAYRGMSYQAYARSHGQESRSGRGSRSSSLSRSSKQSN